MSRDILCSASRLIDNLISSSAESSDAAMLSFTSNRKNAGIAQLKISDSGPEYDSVETFNHFEKPIFENFLRFAMDPVVLMKQKFLRDYWCDEYNSASNDTLRRDVKFCITHEEEEFQHLFKNHKAAIKKFYAAKRNEIALLSKDLDRTLESFEGLITDQVDSIFGDMHILVRTLLFAEDLDAEELQEACIEYISRSECFPQLFQKREFCSSLISGSVIRILHRICDKQLAEIASSKTEVTSRYSALISRERRARRVAFSTDLRKISNEAFSRIMLCATECTKTFDLDIDSEVKTLAQKIMYYPDVEHEEKTRRMQFSNVFLDVPYEMELSDDRFTVQTEAIHRYLTAVGTQPRSAGQFGKWMFEVTIEAIDSCGGSIGIGWLHQGDRTRAGHGIIWQTEMYRDAHAHAGLLYVDGKSISGHASFTVGDVLGCTIDQYATPPIVQFYLNGVQAISGGIPIQDDNYSLYPAACLYVAKRGGLSRVRFNFHGNFDYPNPHFESYSCLFTFGTVLQIENVENSNESIN